MENHAYSSRHKNPLKDLISDEVYEILNSRGLLHETSVRDREIRIRFRILRSQKMKVADAIEVLMKDYPYLQFDTIKKIVHHPPKHVRES